MGKQADRIKKRREDLRRSVSLNFIRHAIDGIWGGRSRSLHHYDSTPPLKIRPLIHKIVLTGDWGTAKHDYANVIWKIFGKLYKDNYKPAERKSLYKEKWIKKTRDFLINIYLFPDPRHRPPFRMEIHVGEHVKKEALKGLLLRIWLAMPTAKVSLVDYTLDQYCYGPHEVQNLFWVEMRNLYVPHQRKARLAGAKLTEWGNGDRMNTAYRAGNVQVYERGPDSKKKGDHWQFTDVNRVRLEYTAKRARLLKKGINTIRDLIDRPRFHELNRNIYRFASFERSKKLPRHYDDYTTPGDKKKNEAEGNIEKRIFGAFQLEFNRYRKGIEQVPGIGQYVKDLYVFEPLKARLDEVMREYDKEWEKTK